MPKTSATAKWQARALAAEAERDAITDKHNALLDRLMTGLVDALHDAGYVTERTDHDE